MPASSTSAPLPPAPLQQQHDSHVPYPPPLPVVSSAAASFSTAPPSAVGAIVPVGLGVPPHLPESNMKKKESSLSRLARRLSGKKARGPSEDSVDISTANSLASTTHPVLPPTEEERRQILSAEIEKAAVDRDEKRKRRVGEALASVHRRLDVASDSILSEMEEALERSTISLTDRIAYAVAIFTSIILWTFPLPILIPFTVCFLVLKSYMTSRKHVVAASDANDDIGARLQDLDDGIRRCELALELDIKAEAEWAQEMEDEHKVCVVFVVFLFRLFTKQCLLQRN